ncbi:1-deoxy-D-xylulose-5-phosphate reductoisomerase [Geminicoccaceae bacterium 1502E]|nr:1-deoxy-D-xylulose-5-phosphate reductoisomerase [Geminicoccaceae bacterium 1502E]
MQPPSRETPRSVTILGATGSIGQSTTALLREQPDLYRVEAVTAGRRGRALAAIARQLGARFAAVADPASYRELAEGLAGSGIEAAAGPEAVVEAAARDAQWVMAAIVGAAGLAPTLAALRRGAIVALANKECLVCAGELVLRAAREGGAVLLPVDSEHNAIFQALAGEDPASVERLVLTASGGPFRTLDLEAMRGVTPAQAVAHPNWSMGAKISVDSATMMNKGLELIEAHYLFDVPEKAIEVLVHPQSVIHSLVAFKDASLLAQLGPPDMRVPIAYALGWPARLATSAPRLDLAALGRLDFEAPDLARFPALGLARRALREGGGAPTILNAANEVAVAAFLDGRIGFLDIARTVDAVLGALPALPVDSLESIAACDARARRRAREAITG